MGKNIKEAFRPNEISIRNKSLNLISVSNIGEARLFATDNKARSCPIPAKSLKENSI
jgi:hypothetical protein